MPQGYLPLRVRRPLPVTQRSPKVTVLMPSFVARSRVTAAERVSVEAVASHGMKQRRGDDRHDDEHYRHDALAAAAARR
jgi:hypothetical protein